MNCCVLCFNDKYIVKQITEAGEKGTCDYCKAQKVHIISAAELGDDFEGLLELYRIAEYGVDYYGDMDAIDVGDDLPTLIQDEWEIFSDRLVESGKHYDLLGDILPAVDITELRIERSSTLMDHWETVSEKLKTDGIDAVPLEGPVTVPLPNGEPFDFQVDVLQWLSEDLSHVGMKVQKGAQVYRARPGYKEDRGRVVSIPLEEMGAPPPAMVDKPARANPAHTAVLYCAEEEATAVAEIRPAHGEFVSVAKLEVVSDLSLVDLSRKVYFKTPFGVQYLRSVVESYELFNHLGDEFAKPLRHRDDVREYVPTQFFARWAEQHGYDGVRYPSAMSEAGQNLVFFNPSNLKALSSRLVEVTSVNVEYKEHHDSGDTLVAPAG